MLFSFSIVAMREEVIRDHPSVVIDHRPGTIEAPNQAEADNQALLLALMLYPRTDGWDKHAAATAPEVL